MALSHSGTFTKSVAACTTQMLWIFRGLPNGYNLTLLSSICLEQFRIRALVSGTYQNELCIFSFSSSWFSSNQHGLILGILKHIAVGCLSNGPQVGWYFIPPLTQVQLHHCLSINWKPFIWVDDNAKQSRVGIDELGLITSFQIVENRCIIQVSQICHVLTFFEFWWVDLSNLVALEGFFLQQRKSRFTNES